MPADDNHGDNGNNGNNGQSLPQLLVVDDDVIQRTIISRVGTQMGYVTASAASFAEAAQLLVQQGFDCVTLDLSLGKDSGVLLLGKIAETNKLAPIIVISGTEPHIQLSTLKIAQSLGLQMQFLTKPLKIADLRAVLARKRDNMGARRGIEQHYQSTSGGAAA
jgi:CheY-like chemotaxis protein